MDDHIHLTHAQPNHIKPLTDVILQYVVPALQDMIDDGLHDFLEPVNSQGLLEQALEDAIARISLSDPIGQQLGVQLSGDIAAVDVSSSGVRVNEVAIPDFASFVDHRYSFQSFPVRRLTRPPARSEIATLGTTTVRKMSETESILRDGVTWKTSFQGLDRVRSR